MIQNHTECDYEEGDCCPNHAQSEFKKMYTFGSSMSAETEVIVFKACKCAVAICHDPVGTYDSRVIYFTSYDNAHGVGKLRAMDAKAKYR